VPRNWDEHYAGTRDIDLTPDPLLVQIAEWVRPGRALDLACGAGRNAIYLARLGWQVTAVDSSAQALRLVRSHSADLAVDVRQADLERGEFAIEPEGYDLICDFLYLQCDLFPAIRAGVRMGGMFAGAMRLTGTYRLEPGELREQFADWKILYYSEVGETASIIARR
jgi:tellurite methyltransferase